MSCWRASGAGSFGTRLKRYGPVFAINVPFFGRSVVVSDPALARQVFLASTDDLINVKPNLSRIFGPGSVFALDGKEHRARRKLLAPPFHGQSIRNYEKVIEEETLRETATWPEGREFPTLEPMNRITLNVILRTVFGADGSELDYLREIIPPWAKLGSRMATLPEPPFNTGRRSPWGRMAEFRRNFDQHGVRVDRKGRGRSTARGPHRHPGAAAAQSIRGRHPDVSSGRSPTNS